MTALYRVAIVVGAFAGGIVEPRSCASDRVATGEAASSTEFGEPLTMAGDTVTLLASDSASLIDLGPVPVRVTLANRLEAGNARFAGHVASLPSDHRLFLVVSDLRADHPPAVIFHLYLNAPAGQSLTERDPHFVGIINFYAATRLHDDPSRPDVEPHRVSFDITTLARTLQRRGALDGPTVVTIVPAGVPAASARAAIGRITLVEQ